MSFFRGICSAKQISMKELMESGAHKILDVKIDILENFEVINRIDEFISFPGRNGSYYICVTNVNSVVEAQRHPYLKMITNESDVSVCDGIPLAWISRLKGFNLKKRVYGFALMNETLKLSEKKGYKNYFYGSTEKVLQGMLENIKAKYPNLKIAGHYSPPFRQLTENERQQVIQDINNSAADIVWVGLGYPKQEIWMYEFRDYLKAAVLIGVGAAFDFFSGLKKQAPSWMQNFGLEWLFRLLSEPRRLWKRYLVNNTLFILLIIKEILIQRFPFFLPRYHTKIV